MKKFKYYRTLEMEPRFGNKFATVYYKMNKQQNAAMAAFVKSVKQDMDKLIEEHQNFAEFDKPLNGFTRTGRSENYSAYQIIKDLNDQLQAGKDPTQGLIGRWNRMCAQLGAEHLDFILIEE